jgi:hypothetical protein
MNIFYEFLFILETVPDNSKAPKFTRTLEDITIHEGTEARLECKVEGYPACNIEWLVLHDNLSMKIK